MPIYHVTNGRFNFPLDQIVPQCANALEGIRSVTIQMGMSPGQAGYTAAITKYDIIRDRFGGMIAVDVHYDESI